MCAALGGLLPDRGCCNVSSYSASLPLLLLSEENFTGVNYSPYHRDRSPAERFTLTDDEIISDLGKIAGAKFVYLRTFGLENGQNKIIPLAKSHYPDLKIFLGVSVKNTCHDNPGDDHCTRWQLNEAINLTNAYDNVVGVVVGNECLPDPNIANNDPVAVATLIADINYVKERLSPARKNGVKVTTCMSWYSAISDQGYPAQGAQIKPYCDVIMVNVFPFWAGIPIGGAPANFEWAWWEIHRPDRYGSDGKPILIGETGWPSQGSCVGQACPSVENEKTYTHAIVNYARGKGIPVFLFEMFDEPWKTAEGNFGAYWGLYDRYGNPKFQPVLP
jgi:exo-beta-1,3-glucanase (GH17 family)